MEEMGGNVDKTKRPVSPVNGVPLPMGKRFERGEEQREKARKAGKKSAEVRRARKNLREELLDLLQVKVEGKNGKKVNTQEAISSALIRQAMMGNVRAYETIRDTIGEKPVENVTIKARGFEALDAAFEGIDAE